MVCKKVVLINKSGLHARPASLFVELANQYRCDIYLKKDTVTVSAKSIMGVMVLGVGWGSEIIIEADGSDEDEALEALVQLVESKFNEDE